jgi:hypothetical protein
MSAEHKLILVDSELEDVRQAVLKDEREHTFECIACKKYLKCPKIREKTICEKADLI